MIIVIDGNNLGHRVFHTPQGALTTKQGEPSGVMLGVIKAIKGYLENFPETTKVVVCWDGGRSVWRKALYPEYKGNRDYGKEDEEKKKAYEGLFAQMEESHRTLHMLGIHSLKVIGEEADDLMAAISYYETDDHVMLITSDKDMLQLVSDRVSVYSPYKDKIITPLNFYEETGVTPEAYIGFRALVGDTSDNITGIHGFGEKTAKKLMDEFGHIDNVLNAQGDDKKKLLKSKVKQRIFEPEGLKTLAINNKIMNFKHVPFSREVADKLHTVFHGEQPQYDGKEFKKWLMRWQYVSVLTNYMPFVTPFLGLGDE